MPKKRRFIYALLAIAVLSCPAVASLHLFPEIFRRGIDPKVVDFVEAAYADDLEGNGDPRFACIDFEKGGWTDIIAAGDSASCRVSIDNGRSYRIEWTSPSSDTTIMTFPVDYSVLENGKTRSEIERNFIEGMKNFGMAATRDLPEFNPESLVELGDSVFMLPGKRYGIEEVTSNLFIGLDDEGFAIPLADTAYPAETLANAFLTGAPDIPEMILNLEILLHEYGKTRRETVPVEQFMQFCASEGCMPYWGVESISESTLAATVFITNPSRGYNHILRISCSPDDLNTDRMEISGRLSLFVPSANVENLFEQYKEKSDDERIKFM